MVKEYHITLVHRYVEFDKLRTQGFAKAELKEFKTAIDDLKEVNEDIESIFFELPFNKEFQEMNSKLANLR